MKLHKWYGRDHKILQKWISGNLTTHSTAHLLVQAIVCSYFGIITPMFQMHLISIAFKFPFKDVSASK